MKKTLQWIIGVAVLLIGAITPADVVVAGWDEQNWKNDARVTEAGVTGTRVVTIVDGSASWLSSKVSRDIDGTFGSLGAGADVSEDGYGSAIDSRGTNTTDEINTTSTYTDFTVTNGSTNSYQLTSFSFDAWHVSKSLADYSLSITGGDITLANDFATGIFATKNYHPYQEQNGSSTNDYDDFDISLASLSDKTLRPGESATFRLTLTDSAPEDGGWLYMDNFAVLGTAVPRITATVVDDANVRDSKVPDGTGDIIDNPSTTYLQVGDGAYDVLRAGIFVVELPTLPAGEQFDDIEWKCNLSSISSPNASLMPNLQVDVFFKNSGSVELSDYSTTAVASLPDYMTPASVAGYYSWFDSALVSAVATVYSGSTTPSSQYAVFRVRWPGDPAAPISNGMNDYYVLSSTEAGSPTPGPAVTITTIPASSGESSIISIGPAGANSLKLNIFADGSLEDFRLVGTTNLTEDSWSYVAHSDTVDSGFAISNLSYSASEGTNAVIYVDASAAAGFYGICQ